MTPDDERRGVRPGVAGTLGFAVGALAGGLALWVALVWYLGRLYRTHGDAPPE